MRMRSLGPNEIHTPGIFVQRILAGGSYENRIERLEQQAA
jgi:3-oxoacid CoA-transferase subunit A